MDLKHKFSEIEEVIASTGEDFNTEIEVIYFKKGFNSVDSLSDTEHEIILDSLKGSFQKIFEGQFKIISISMPNVFLDRNSIQHVFSEVFSNLLHIAKDLKKSRGRGEEISLSFGLNSILIEMKGLKFFRDIEMNISKKLGVLRSNYHVYKRTGKLRNVYDLSFGMKVDYSCLKDKALLNQGDQKVRGSLEGEAINV